MDREETAFVKRKKIVIQDTCRTNFRLAFIFNCKDIFSRRWIRSVLGKLSADSFQIHTSLLGKMFPVTIFD